MVKPIGLYMCTGVGCRKTYNTRREALFCCKQTPEFTVVIPPKLHKYILQHEGDIQALFCQTDAFLEENVILGGFRRGRMSGLNIAYFLASGACESCGSRQSLTIQHLVQSGNHPFLSFKKYLAQRNHYRNLAILCRMCHVRADKQNRTDNGDSMVALSAKRIAGFEAFCASVRS